MSKRKQEWWHEKTTSLIPREDKIAKNTKKYFIPEVLYNHRCRRNHDFRIIEEIYYALFPNAVWFREGVIVYLYRSGEPTGYLK